MNRNLLILTLLLLLTASVHAELIVNKYTNDFTLSSPNNEQLKLCACETKTDTIVIENTGSFYADFHVTAMTAYPRNLRISMPDFSLAPKHFQEVTIYVEDSCGVLGTFPYDVVVTNSYGREQRLSRSIRSDLCQTSALEVVPYGDQTVGLCTPATYAVTMKNVGTFADAYTLETGPYNATAPQPSVYLVAGQSFTQNVTFSFACQEYGTKYLPFTILTAKNGPGASAERTLTILNQYGFKLDAPDISMCAKDTLQFPVTLGNSANAPDDVALRVETPPFVAGPIDTHLAPLESKNLTFTASPAQPGAYTLRISAADRWGGVQKAKEARLDVLNCYDVSVETRITPSTAFTAPVQNCCGPTTYYVNVRNNADQEQVIMLRLDGPSIFTLDETSVRLGPKENANVPIRANLPCADQRYEATVTAWPETQPLVNASAKLVVDSQTQRTCHMIQIDDDERSMRQTQSVLPVMVKQTGSAPGNYTITVNSTLFTLQEKNVSLAPGTQQELHLIPLVNLSTQELGRYLVQPTFTLADQGIQYHESVGVQLRGKSLSERFSGWWNSINWSGFTPCVILVLLLFLLVVCMIIILLLIYAGRVLFDDGLPRRTLTLLKTILVVLLLLVLLFTLFGLQRPNDSLRYERVADHSNPTVVEWYQGTTATLELNQYFVDPDKDYLSYTATQPTQIKATVTGSTLTLTPDDDFAGNDTLVVTANDNKGGVTKSPPFTLHVIAKRHLSLLGWIDVWCKQLAMLLLLALLLIAFLILLTVKEHRPKPYENNVLVLVEKKAKRRRKPARRAAARAGRRATRQVAVIPRSRQVVTLRRGARPVVSEFKGSGQTVNIAVGTPAATPAVVTVPGVKPNEVIYIGSKNGDKVHTPYCMIARRIPKQKRVAFSSKREAMNAKLIPCKMCRPFEGGI